MGLVVSYRESRGRLGVSGRWNSSTELSVASIFMVTWNSIPIRFSKREVAEDGIERSRGEWFSHARGRPQGWHRRVVHPCSVDENG